MSQPGLPIARDFREFIACLNAHRVDCVLVGGYAVGWHGAVRATGDIDFLYATTAANVKRLCAAMTEFGAPDHVISPEFMMTPDAITMIGLPPLRIDLLASISGVSWTSVRSSAVTVALDGERLRVIGLAALKANKAASGRDKDLRDLARLNQLATKSTSARRRKKS